MSREPPIGKPTRAAFFISGIQNKSFLSASFGSAAVSKTVRRGFDTLRRCLTLPIYIGWRRPLTSTQRSRHFPMLVTVASHAARASTGSGRPPTTGPTRWRRGGGAPPGCKPDVPVTQGVRLPPPPPTPP
jgi:hypothetical protein